VSEEPGLEISRVAEVITGTDPGKPRRRGSGYLVTPDSVLTAAHVVDGAAAVTVRFDADQDSEWSTAVTGVLEIPEIDVALLTINSPFGGLAPALFGRIGQRDAVIECSAVGFPLWKLRTDADGRVYRDSCHVHGSAAVFASRREGTLEIAVPPPEHDPDPEKSPWEAMSGAAVFCAGRVVGVITKQHRREGLGRLTASRVDRWQSLASGEQWEKLCIRLKALSGLADVVPQPVSDLVKGAYLAQVRDIAPERLRDRDDEIAELVAFCTGPDQYQWWQGDPKAGKTALAAWFALNPPAGVQVASFFITSRLADQSDSAAFTEAMLDQFAALAHEPVPTVFSPAARDGLRRELLERAAARLRQRGERLMLVVDGLDEDTGTGAGNGRASIASLLPERPPDGVRVLVTSRVHPPLPGDVPELHALRSCPIRKLAPSPHAAALMWSAELELRGQLARSGIGREILALITAAGSGLTAAELAELTRVRRYEIEDRLGTVLGRSLDNRATVYEVAEERVFLFAHETLRDAAAKILEHDLDRYRQKIHTWADRYGTRRWPEETPRYLLRSYGRMLTAVGDVKRLAALAADSARHDLMMRRTGSGTSARIEITSAQDFLLASAIPDLKALLLIVAEQSRIADRTGAIPPALCGAWVRLGRLEHALDLAHSIIARPADRATALAEISIALTGKPALAAQLALEAEQVARTELDRERQRGALLAAALATAKFDSSHALELTQEILDSSRPWERDAFGRPQITADIVRVRAAAGIWELDKSACYAPFRETGRILAEAEVARYAAVGDPARAAQLADDAERSSWHSPKILPAVATAIAATYPHRAAAFALKAEREYRSSPSRVSLEPAVALSVVEALAAAGLPAPVELVATPSAFPPGYLAGAASAYARCDPALATRLAEEAEQYGLDHGRRSLISERMPPALAEALVIAGSPGRAREIVEAISANGAYDPRRHTPKQLLSANLDDLMRRLDSAEEPRLEHSWTQAAEDLAEEICRLEPMDCSHMLAGIAERLAATRPDRAEEFLLCAEDIVRSDDWPSHQRISKQAAISLARWSALEHSPDAERRVRRLLAWALGDPRWWKILPLIARVAPEAVVALHDWMLALEGGRSSGKTSEGRV